MIRSIRRWMACVLIVAAGPGSSALLHAQTGATDKLLVRKLDPPQSNLPPPTSDTPRAQSQLRGTRPAILLTGYWPPSNEAVRRFSPSPAQNPLGWAGSNWEGRGYDVYAYFPEFVPPDCTNCGPGSGDFEVDYQDTASDFWLLANALQPIAIITFSRGSLGSNWEVEYKQLNRANWVPDYIAPTQPTPAPPDSSLPAGTARFSTLPMQEIVDDVYDSNAGIPAFVSVTAVGGGFLSEFIAYHGTWYQGLHASPQDPAWCVAAGHIHIGMAVTWSAAQRLAEISLRTVIRQVDRVVQPGSHAFDLYCATSANTVGLGAVLSPLGSASLASNDLGFGVDYAPASSNGLLYYGPGRSSTAYGNGTLCASAPRVRVPTVLTTDANGELLRSFDLTQFPFASGPGAVLAGSTWNFQFAYRDPAAGQPAYNATNAVEVVFGP